MGCLSEETLLAAVAQTKQAFLELLSHECIADLAFVGNTSEKYKWEPTPIVDFDVCVFVSNFSAMVGKLLLDRVALLSGALGALGVDFETRIVRGPYKRALETIERPVLVAHTALYTEESYAKSAAPFLRWGWRKYACEREPARLARLAGVRPSLVDLLNARGGVRQRLQTLRLGRLTFTELVLPLLRETRWEVGSTDPLFAEVCFAAGAACARNHGRALCAGEADELGNQDYFAWYRRTVFDSEDLARLIELKSHARQSGYRNLCRPARRHATAYLNALAESLERGLPTEVSSA